MAGFSCKDHLCPFFFIIALYFYSNMKFFWFDNVFTKMKLSDLLNDNVSLYLESVENLV